MSLKKKRSKKAYCLKINSLMYNHKIKGIKQMKTNIIKSILTTILFSFAMFATTHANNNYQDKSTHVKKQSDMKMDSTMKMEKGMKMDKKENYFIPKEYK